MSEDLLALCRNQGWVPDIVVGHSAGAAIALRMWELGMQPTTGIVGINAALGNFKGVAGWLFPIMWLIVSKPTQLVGVWRLITSVSDAETSLPLLVYCLHLSLGDAWNKVFFGLQCTGRGLVVISAFWTALLTSVYLFYQADSTAGLFLVPTFLWVTVATSLNASIYQLNKNA